MSWIELWAKMQVIGVIASVVLIIAFKDAKYYQTGNTPSTILRIFVDYLFFS